MVGEQVTRLSWVSAMMALSALDVALHWLNLVEQLSEAQYHGIGFGPPRRKIAILLTIFTVVRSVAYILESINTLSVCRLSHKTLIPITFDVTMSLLLAHLPLNVLNFMRCSCCLNYMTPIQSTAAACQILLVFGRLVWHAHLQGAILREALAQATGPTQDKALGVEALFLACCAVLAVAITFPITSWRNQPSLSRNATMYHVSVFMCDIDQQATQTRMIVQNLNNIASAGAAGYTTDYDCGSNASKTGCTGVLRFRLVYSRAVRPLGSVYYNFVNLTAVNQTQVSTNQQSSDNWTLCYKQLLKNKQGRFVLVDPWPRACIMPTPWYDNDLSLY